MIARSPEHAIALIDKAFEEADIDTLVGLYEEHAVLIPTATVVRQEIRGRQQLHDFYSGLLAPGRFTVRQHQTHVVQVDDIALVTIRWTLSAKDRQPQTLIATVVFRRQADGAWMDLIDSGPAVLDQSDGIESLQM
ncbi:nuclear transport factor 2 family protein [Paraburkholderia sp. BL25I1N1]|uniref:YybH family protein n=1 Tax=Paraburkholderia sp. BL25I1N1 TaxID=1938804 RepID=UPI000D05B983|nr:nuclear transport factor 2 family protein [Paraburkholderia sp. BL25I1N1]PRY04365.1 ketosteroid isomerase-like protein [Paraburkholderia sp. BL25I1N1]